MVRTYPAGRSAAVNASEGSETAGAEVAVTGGEGAVVHPATASPAQRRIARRTVGEIFIE